MIKDIMNTKAEDEELEGCFRLLTKLLDQRETKEDQGLLPGLGLPLVFEDAP